MPEDMDNTAYGASHLSAANKDQNQIGLRIQGYGETVPEQPEVDLNTIVNTTLKNSEKQIKDGLGCAKDHAR